MTTENNAGMVALIVFYTMYGLGLVLFFFKIIQKRYSESSLSYLIKKTHKNFEYPSFRKILLLLRITKQKLPNVYFLYVIEMAVHMVGKEGETLQKIYNVIKKRSNNNVDEILVSEIKKAAQLYSSTFSPFDIVW